MDIHKLDEAAAAIVTYTNNVLKSYGFEPTCALVSLPSGNGISRYYLSANIRLQKPFELTSADKLEENGQKYYVTYEPLKAYTTIGATNIHHAFNKATKDFKGKYTKLIKVQPPRVLGWEFLSVKEFGELLRKVPN